MWQWFLHRVLKRPYILHVRTDQGQGKTVVLLHGIASSGNIWRYLVKLLASRRIRVIVPDLLGFGLSQKPREKWVRYTATDHAEALLATLDKCNVSGKITLVGHSMGCFVAIEAARMRPRLVKKLILYEPPFYAGLPETSSYKKRLKAYFRFYTRLITKQPTGISGHILASRLVSTITGFELRRDSWVPFQRSMKHAILQQTALEDLKTLTIPTEIIYGRYDRLAFSDSTHSFFDQTHTHITTTELPELHHISHMAAQTIANLLSD